MAVRVTQIKGRSGWYVEVDRPLWIRKLQGGGNSVKRKGGNTRQEALRNALLIEAKLLEEWEELKETNPIKRAAHRARTTGEDLPDAMESLMREAGWSLKARERVLTALVATPEQLEEQGLINELDKQTQALVDAAKSDIGTWQDWVASRKKEEQVAANTVKTWEVKLQLLSTWLGSDHVGILTRKQAHEFKLHIIDKGFTVNSIRAYISSYSGFWNWAIRSGQLEGENIWNGLKTGLGTPAKRQSLDPELLAKAEAKADEIQDIRFWFGRYQGLRKEDYCGLRYCDIDADQKVIHLKRYVWKGQKRNLKLKEAGERTVPIHSKLLKRLELYLPEAFINNKEEPIWPKDYTVKTEAWGSSWAAMTSKRYGFGSHCLRSYVVTQMLKQNINPYFLKEITGHSVPGLGSVVAGYVAPNVEEVREVLELLD